MIQDDFEFEPIRGLPQPLPDGEKLLWQGAPDWGRLTRSVFHVRAVAVYFAILLAWGVGSAAADGLGLRGAAQSFLWLVPLAMLSCGMLTLIAWLTAKTTVYSITSKRIVMRIGVALPITINFPFTIVESAALKADAEGFGDIALALSGTDKFAYLILWPHARPWRWAKPEPMLRAVPQAARVSAILAGALTSFSSATKRSAPGLKVYEGSRPNRDARGCADQDSAAMQEKAS
ncbi:photosynthetic complex putative assembly protein PuhB [Methylocella silvestris]|uniref:Phosphopantetheine adenylyltransferase n=1 Tax=Methylocella silvestris TaxID=199596 RepID=A0A2J7TDC3_METSI|nr:photosynthetic complex putative assembly protein PuhB [Methylocella silvestris]PNG24777.1 phosphopantetheine adenylyltransferase [Methylocella silvestris]